MLRWHHTAVLPSDIHLLGRLPREVRNSLSSLSFSGDLIKYRVIIASIRDKGHCLCPRCLIPKSRVQNLGTAQDMKQRKSLVRLDDETKRHNIKTARDLIYQKNYAVNSEAVKAILQKQSLVPTAVSAVTVM
jgi:hypothetical protein